MQRGEDAIEDAAFAVAAKAFVDGLPLAVARWDVAPGRAGAELPEDAVERGAVVGTLRAAGGDGQERLDEGELLIGEFVAALRHGGGGEWVPKLARTESQTKPSAEG